MQILARLAITVACLATPSQRSGSGLLGTIYPTAWKKNSRKFKRGSRAERKDEQYGYPYDRRRGAQCETQYEHLERSSSIPGHSMRPSQASYASVAATAT
jgi:hypothetical protein